MVLGRACSADLPTADEVPLQNVNGFILSKVLDYINFHGETEDKDGEAKPKRSEEERKNFDTEFVKVDQSVLFEIILVRSTL